MCETAWSRRQTVFHTYVGLTESRDVAIVWEVSAGGSRENVGSGRAEVIELLYRREGEL